jgi:hypothetical protein
MTRPCPHPLPEASILAPYRAKGAYTDCFILDVPGNISHAQFVEAFYTSLLFKVERAIISALVSKPSTDEQAAELAAGARDQFAAWTLERRTDNQLLLCDYQGRTRSWLMVSSCEAQGAASTRLWFGTAVVPSGRSKVGTPQMPFTFRLLLWAHVIYAKALLRSSARKLASNA